MNEKEIEIHYVNIKPDYCRICVRLSYSECFIHEIDSKDGQSMTLYAMMERLVPSVFNAAQMELDESMNWPNKICIDCRRRLFEAYELYDMCINSEEMLRKCLPQVEILETVLDDAEEKKANFADDATIEVEIKLEEEVIPIHRVRRSKKPNNPATKNEATTMETSDVNEEECSTTMFHNENFSDGDEEQETAVSKRANAGRKPRRKAATKSSTKKNPRGSSGQLEKEGRTKRNKLSKQMEKSLKGDLKSIKGNTDEYSCLLCAKPAYKSPIELTEHLKAEHLDQIHTCELCPKVFMSEQPFQHHQYCHATGRSYFCTFCDKGFQTEQLQQNHIRTHTHGANYLCSLCGKVFVFKSSLREHMLLHTVGKPWACDRCPSRFTTKGALTKHHDTHTKVKAFSCDTCGSQFNKNYSLIKHKLIHTGERPFGCDVCLMRFHSSYAVKRHKLTHTGERPFKCTYCERGFAQSNVLVKHMKVHIGDNPYQCDRCDASFRLLTDLRNHYKEHYQTKVEGANSTSDDDKSIRFTSTDILKLRYEKEKKSNQEI